MVKSKTVKEIADIIQYKPETLLDLVRKIDPSVKDINAPVTTDQYKELTKLIKRKKQASTQTQSFVSKKTEVLAETTPKKKDTKVLKEANDVKTSKNTKSKDKHKAEKEIDENEKKETDDVALNTNKKLILNRL